MQLVGSVPWARAIWESETTRRSASSPVVAKKERELSFFMLAIFIQKLETQSSFLRESIRNEKVPCLQPGLFLIFS